MTHLVYFVCPGHPAPDVQQKYRDALAPLGDVALVWLARPGLSSVFRDWGNSLKRDGRILPELLRQHPPPHNSRPASISIISFSAGYGLVREILKHEDDRAALDALVLLDSLHAGLDPDDTADDNSLMPFILYAQAAVHGACRFFSAYTDVETHGYASTTQSNAELVRLAGGMGGDFWVREYNMYGANQQKREHGAALTEWGPAFVSEALLPYLRRVVPSVADTQAWRDQDLRLGLRACAWLGYQFGLDPREAAGPKHNPLILSYSRHCKRGGVLLGVSIDCTPRWSGGAPLSLRADEDAWCAAVASECLRVCLMPGEAPPHGLRVSVRELVEDARKAGTLCNVDFMPRPGDLAIEARAGGDPLKGGQGHVRRVIQVDGDRYLGIGGNEDNRIQAAWHMLKSDASRGWIAYA